MGTTAKKILLEFIGYLQYKVENDLMTLEEVESMSKMFEENMMLTGTADDFAKFYDKPKTNVSSVINRRMLTKPTRKVYHSFNEFRKVKPPSWGAHNKSSVNQ